MKSMLICLCVFSFQNFSQLFNMAYYDEQGDQPTQEIQRTEK